MNEERIFELKQLCNKKWRVENPKGYFGQMRHGSVREATEWMCRLAGFGSLEEADVYFRHQDKVEQEDMIKQADVIQRSQPGWTPEQQKYIRSQTESGLEGVEVRREMPKMITAPIMLAIGIIVVVWLLLVGRIRK